MIELSQAGEWNAATSYLELYEQNYGELQTRKFTPMIRKFSESGPSEFAVEANKALSLFSRSELGSDTEMVSLKKSSPFFDDRLGVST